MSGWVRFSSPSFSKTGKMASEYCGYKQCMNPNVDLNGDACMVCRRCVAFRCASHNDITQCSTCLIPVCSAHICRCTLCCVNCFKFSNTLLHACPVCRSCFVSYWGQGVRCISKEEFLATTLCTMKTRPSYVPTASTPVNVPLNKSGLNISSDLFNTE